MNVPTPPPQDKLVQARVVKLDPRLAARIEALLQDGETLEGWVSQRVASFVGNAEARKRQGRDTLGVFVPVDRNRYERFREESGVEGGRQFRSVMTGALMLCTRQPNFVRLLLREKIARELIEEAECEE